MVSYTIAEDGSFVAPLEVAYPFTRTLGPVLSRFFTALRDGRVEGARAADGSVWSPPAEFDPRTGEPAGEFVDVGPGGVIENWAWDPTIAAAWALIRLDGADVAMLHRVDAAQEALSEGLRVTARWAEERSGLITDIAGFVPEEDMSAANGLPTGRPPGSRSAMGSGGAAPEQEEAS